MKKTEVSKEEYAKIINDVISSRKAVVKHLGEYATNSIMALIEAKIKLETSTIKPEERYAKR